MGQASFAVHGERFDLPLGRRAFWDTVEPRELALVATRAAAFGVLINTHRPVGPIRTGSFTEPPV